MPPEIEKIRETLPKRKEDPKDKIQPKASPDDMQYTVQLASLGDKQKAEELISRLIDKGYPAYYYEVNVKGRIYYRIRCGRFLERGEAEIYGRKLQKEAGIKGFVSRIE